MIPDSVQFCFLVNRGYIYPSGTIPLWSTREKHFVIALLSYCCWYRLAAWCTAQQQWNSTSGGGLLLLWKSDHFMLHHNFSVLSVFPSDKIAQIWILAPRAGQGQRKLLSFHQHTTICVRAKKCGLWKGKFFYFICLSRNASRKTANCGCEKFHSFPATVVPQWNARTGKHEWSSCVGVSAWSRLGVSAVCVCLLQTGSVRWRGSCSHSHFVRLLLHGLLHPT